MLTLAKHIGINESKFHLMYSRVPNKKWDFTEDCVECRHSVLVPAAAGNLHLSVPNHLAEELRTISSGKQKIQTSNFYIFGRHYSLILCNKDKL